MTHRNLAWAVRITYDKTENNPRQRFLAGRYWYAQPHASHEGCRLCLFATRKLAKLWIEGRNQKATPVRVEVTVKELRR